MANSFAVNISAKDSASGTLDSINKRIASMTKQVALARAPFDQLAGNAAKFAKVTGLDKVGASMAGVARSGFSAFQAVARIVEPLAAITGAASIAGMMRLATAWADFGTQLGNTAARAGLTSDQLQALQNAGRLAGVSTEALSGGMISLRDNMVNAVGGRAPQVIGMLQALGLNLDDARRYAADTTKALPELADKIAALRNPTLQAQAATALFGGAGEALLPFLRRGSAGIAEYTEKARRYGLINAEGVAAANRLREAQATLAIAVEGLGNSVAQRLAPVLGPLLTQMADWIAANREWISTGIGDKVEQLSGYLQGHAVDWARVGTDINDVVHAVKWLVDELGGIVPAGEKVLKFMLVVWAIPLMAAIVKIGLALGAIPGKAAAAAAAAEAEMSAAKFGSGLLGKLGIAAVGGTAAHEILKGIDPDDRLGASIDRNVPFASGVDNFASRFGLGRSYQEQQEVERRLYPGGHGTVGPNVNLSGRGAHPGETGRRDPTRPSGRNATGAQWSTDLAQLQGYGWTKAQAAGLLGNFSQESEGNAQAVGDNGSAYGLGQWHADRQANFASQFGHDIHQSTHEEQLRFANWELNNTERGAGDHLRAATGVRESAAAARRYYERPADANGREDGLRGDRGEGIYRLAEPSGPSLSLPANAGTAASPGPIAPVAVNGQVGVSVRVAAPAGTTTTATQSGSALAPLQVRQTDVGHGDRIST